MLTWSRKFLLAFLLGLMTFTPWDILFVRFEIVEYPRANFLGIPAWVPLAFGLLAVVTMVAFHGLEKIFPSSRDYPPHRLFYEYFLIAGFYIGILFFHSSPYLLSLILGVVLLSRLLFFHRSWDFVFFLLGVCIGPTVELLLTHLGLYTFTEPDFLGMPFWLPWLWGQIALALRRFSWVLDPPPLARKKQNIF